MIVLQYNTKLWKLPLTIAACGGCTAFTGVLQSKLICDETQVVGVTLTHDVCNINYHIVEIQADPYIQLSGDYTLTIYCDGGIVYKEDVRFNYENVCPLP